MNNILPQKTVKIRTAFLAREADR